MEQLEPCDNSTMLIQIALLLALAQDAEKAQRLHSEMVAAVLDSTTLQVDYRCEAGSGGVVARHADGKLLMQSPDHCSHKFEVKADDKIDPMWSAVPK